MGEERKTPGITFWATATATGLIVAVALAYGTAYFYMVNGPRYASFMGQGPWIQSPDYRGKDQTRDQRFWEVVFRPAHWLDKRVRRDKWIIE